MNQQYFGNGSWPRRSDGDNTRKQVGGQVTLAEVETRGYSELASEANPASIACETRRPLGPRWRNSLYFSQKIIVIFLKWRSALEKSGKILKIRSRDAEADVTVCWCRFVVFSAFFECAV